MSRRLAPLMLTVLLLLTGCTAAGAPSPTSDPGDTQSLGDACATVAETVTEAITDFGSVDPADPAAAAVSVARIAERLEAASASIGNSRLAALLPQMQGALAEFGEIMADVAAGDLGRTAALAGPSARLRESFATFRTLCTQG